MDAVDRVATKSTIVSQHIILTTLRVLSVQVLLGPEEDPDFEEVASTDRGHWYEAKAERMAELINQLKEN